MLSVGGRRLQTKPGSPGKVLRAHDTDGPQPEEALGPEGGGQQSRTSGGFPHARGDPATFPKPRGSGSPQPAQPFPTSGRKEGAPGAGLRSGAGGQVRARARRPPAYSSSPARGAASPLPALTRRSSAAPSALRAIAPPPPPRPRLRPLARLSPPLPRVPAGAPPAPPRSSRPEGRSPRPPRRPTQGRGARCGRREENGTVSPPELLAPEVDLS
ncbi:proline-rich protein HaeIII subfamily 1-like [Mustela lutreola]|uniref:proline-rich protein HaeIII subfamily 1-like n=1 Tax=Mustela lutreola TaxID=9666 RepID=UPI002797C7BB|nr:proline-rich protein HaeIII subfamily 1-like [Mustela lutreola]